MNGLAAAPPAISDNTGVSTSKNPLLSKNSLIADTILLLFMKVSFTSGLVIISTSLCLYLKSGSFNPCHFSGNGFNDLQTNSKVLTFILIFVVLIFCGHGINVLALCFLPIVFLVEYVLALGICMLTSALTVYFRDLEYILNILAMAWMYLSPIMYTTEMVPENLRSIFKLNPLTAIIEAYHEILYYKMIPQISTLGSAIIWGIVFLIVGVFTFEKLQKNFVEEL